MARSRRIARLVCAFAGIVVIVLGALVHTAGQTAAPGSDTAHAPGKQNSTKDIEPDVDQFPTVDTTYPPYTFRPVNNLAFGVGETLKFSIGWEKIVAGYAQATVPEIVERRGRTCFHAVSTAHSTKLFSTFFNVEDWAESFFDAREIIPVHFEKHLSEGKYRADQIVDFYPESRVAVTQKDTVPVSPYVQDALSLLYFVRTQPLKVGDTLYVDNFSKDKSYRLEIRVVKRERIQVKAGTFNTLMVEPLLQAAGLFKHKGRLTVWLTDDRLKMPVLMKSKVIVGSIVAELEEYKLGRLTRFER